MKKKVNMKKTLILALGLLAVSGCTTTKTTPEKKDLFVVESSKSKYQIVIPEETDAGHADVFVQQSAKLLQDCIEEASGISLPILRENAYNKSIPAFFLGNTHFARANGIHPRELTGWTYIEKAIGENIILAGNDRPDIPDQKSKYYSRHVLGTLKAVTSFLERSVGVRFLLPGPNGIEVPTLSCIAVNSDLDLKRTPYIKLSSGRHAEMVYDIANNYLSSNSIKMNGGHSYYTAVPKETFGKTHPEYFALLGGKRNPASNHLCISNPHVQDLMYKEMLKQLDIGYGSYEIGQTDGYKPCECENCEKLFATSDPGEKLWILHKQLAEMLLKDRPGKKAIIIAYGPTANPPKTFKTFPDNVVVELSRYSEEAFKKWDDYRISGGFMAYIYNWGQYQQPGLTPKTTPQSVGAQAERFRKNNVRAIYKCGWGEFFGLEGPVYYVYGQMFADVPQDYKRLTDNFYKSAYGEAYIPMKIFFDTMYKRLELYANFLGSGAPAEGFSPENSKPIIAYNFSPEILEKMEKNLKKAEEAAEKTKVKKRIALVRKEFDYVKNLASVVHFYNTYKMSPDQSSFEKLADRVEERNAMLDSYYDSEGRMHKVSDWNDVKFLGGFSRDTVQVNGRLGGTMSSPLAWDTLNLRKLGILPGTLKKQLEVFETTGSVSLDGNLESGVWESVPFESIGGIQAEKVSQTTQFKMIYDAENLYVGFSCTLPGDKMDIHSVGRDGPAWQQECLELFFAPDGLEEFFHLIFNPAENSQYDAVNSMLIDPLSPLFGKGDDTWNGDWEYRNYIDEENKEWKAIVRIPFKSLNADTPKAGNSWQINVGRGHFFLDQHRHKKGPELYLWSPNLETRSFHDREAFGELIFSGKK